ncbi:MAG TPA: winged helix-turn-helix domain-containing protein [Burkholderiales bacterium]|jgi:TolB-like protein|nr:winged helix-turn-helix domain-containing protein [Burkholderiales bacterium]
MRYVFDDCALDIDRRELWRGHERVAVEPQVFDLLVHLIRHRDRVVSKDDLLAAVWHGRVVSESALFNRINAARKALADTGETQRLIKTLPRKGLRFVGKVFEEAPGSPPLPERPSIAVLPFANMSGNPRDEYFADGISEDLVTGLAHIRWLFVIARNSTFAYKGRAVDARQVARELGVRYVLEGSVRRAGERLRITAQLIDAGTGAPHWAERFDRQLGDIFAVQDEITRSVAAAIEPRVLAAEGVRALARSPEHLGAWDLVAQGQAHFWRLTRADFEAAVQPLQRAVEGYPDYAPAHGRLGFCLAFAAHMGWTAAGAGMQRGREHAVRAIALDDRDPWGHIALGYCAMMERRTGESIAAFAQAVELNPNSAAAHSHLSRGLAFAGRDGEAIAHGEEAIRLSPFDPEMALFLGAIAVAHYTAGRYEEAARHTAEALRRRPGFQGAQRLQCASLARMGRLEEARGFLATVRQAQPDLSIDWVRANIPYQTPELLEAFVDGLRKAGLR